MFGLSTRKDIENLREGLRRFELALHEARREAATEQQRANDAEKRADLAQNNFEWARVQLNRVEQERALLLSHLLKFPVPAVAIDRQTPFEQQMDRFSMDDSIFDDLGDREAIRQGLTHDVDGRVIDRSRMQDDA